MLGIHNDLVHHDFIDGFTGIVDLPEGASAGYGLRRLSSSWAGKAILIRRENDDQEQGFGFVQSGNQPIDVNAIETFCTGTNGFVVSWYDQTGQANHVTQTDHALQPQIVSSGSIIRNSDNSLPAIRFNGDGLKRSAADTNLLLNPGSDVENSVFIVCKASTGNTSSQDTFATDIAQSRILQSGTSDDGWYIMPSIGPITSSMRTVSSNLYNTYIHIARNVVSTVSGGVNGSFSTLSSALGDSSGTERGIFVGRGLDDSSPNRFDGFIQEMLYYNLTITDAQAEDISDTVNSFYGVY